MHILYMESSLDEYGLQVWLSIHGWTHDAKLSEESRR